MAPIQKRKRRSFRQQLADAHQATRDALNQIHTERALVHELRVEHAALDAKIADQAKVIGYAKRELEKPVCVTPVPMFLTCPMCSARHIDEDVFATKVHHTHSCQNCGLSWRPAIVATVGVQFLPGFKNESGK